MGQKVNPIGLRVGINRTWDSRWYASGSNYTKLLREDLKIRELLSRKLERMITVCQQLMVGLLLTLERQLQRQRAKRRCVQYLTL